MTTAVVFPGQGSQYVGMGKQLYDDYSEARDVFHEASDVLGFNVAALCFEGPEDRLKLTSNTQPAILTASIAAFRVLEARGFSAAMAAGHSLGEYSALVAAGSMRFADVVSLVQKRGQLMEGASLPGEGTMAAVLGLEPDKVLEACRSAASCGAVEPANYNSPGQIVISGKREAVEAAAELCKAAGAKRVVPLQVSGPFHSSLMSSVSEKLAELLTGIEVYKPKIPVVANFTARPAGEPDEIRSLLAKQVSGAVRWEESIRLMGEAGVDLFVEVGPGKVLTGLIKKIIPQAATANIEDTQSLMKFIESGEV